MTGERVCPTGHPINPQTFVFPLMLICFLPSGCPFWQSGSLYTFSLPAFISCAVSPVFPVFSDISYIQAAQTIPAVFSIQSVSLPSDESVSQGCCGCRLCWPPIH